MSAPDPTYDLIAAFDEAAPGVLLQRDILDGLAAAYAAGAYGRLSTPEIIAVTGPLPTPLTGIPWMEAV